MSSVEISSSANVNKFLENNISTSQQIIPFLTILVTLHTEVALSFSQTRSLEV